MGLGGRCPLVDRRKRRGEYLYLEGEPATHVWFVKRGTVVLARAGGATGGPDRPRAVRQAGAFLGLEALVRPSYVDTARVVAATVVCGGRREQIDEWLGPHGSPARMALEQVLRSDAEDVPRATSRDGSAVARVAEWLLREADGAPDASVPRRFTAGLLGMAPETFSRALRKLTTAGAIDVTRTRLRVKDAARLRAAAELVTP